MTVGAHLELTRPRTICLVMIVRNEAHVLRRCLDSVRSVLDCWVIVDTGSHDGSQEIARDALRDLPGEVIERPWRDFGHNRTEAYELARGRADFVLVIDADETLVVDQAFASQLLTADAYRLESRYGGQRYGRIQLLRSALPWRWVGVVHEHPECDVAAPASLLAQLSVEVSHDGARARDPHTYRRDALALEAELLERPGDPRTVFYLAQSYRDAGDYELAVRHYQARVGLGGWSDEIWYAQYQIARLRQAMGGDLGQVVISYLAAFESAPDRAEPLYWLAQSWEGTGADATVHLLLARALELPRPGLDRLFVDADVYDHLVPLAYAEVCGRIGRHPEAIATCNRLLRDDRLPPDRVDLVVRCRRVSLEALGSRSRRLRPSPAPRVQVCLLHRHADDDLDGFWESVGLLSPGPDDVVVLDTVGSSDPTVITRAASDWGVPVTVRRLTPTEASDEWPLAVAAESADQAEVIMLVEPDCRFAGADALRLLAAEFTDASCRAAYGQHRGSDGRTGTAEPATDPADFDRRGIHLLAHSPLAVHAGLLTEVAATEPGANAIAALLTAAGHAATRFTDAVLTVHSDRFVIEASPAAPPPTALRPASTPSGASVMINERGPTVSCLMVTKNRLILARRAIDCLRAQTHANVELVIVTDGTPRYGRLLQTYALERGLEVKLVPVTGPLHSLGALRNLSFAAATGEVVCQWDDDDCSHPTRIARQLDRLRTTDSGACLLTDHLQYLADNQALVWVDWTLGGRSGRDQLLPGTLMMAADRRFGYPETGPYAQRGEDSALLNSLVDRVPVASLQGEGHLYLYTYHGRNTFDREHHHRMGMFSRSVAELRAHRAVITEAMGHYPLPRPYLVVGRDGPAFWLAA